MFKVDVLMDNEWKLYSWHKNKDNAEDMGSTYCKSRKCPGRIVREGLIVGEITERGEVVS